MPAAELQLYKPPVEAKGKPVSKKLFPSAGDGIGKKACSGMKTGQGNQGENLSA
jgi:hypothetical protein